MPVAGPLDYLATPEAAEDVRIETGVREGDQVSRITVHQKCIYNCIVTLPHGAKAM